MPKQKKVPLGKLLVERGYFEDQDHAARWIMAGKVIVNSQRANSAAEKVKADADIIVKGIDLKYVGKGGLKLEGALSFFDFDVDGKVALDVGASTGGFTDCLLQHGAAKVYAIDVGYGQLAGKLRVDQRVVNMERINISDVKPEQLVPKPEVATIDLSYLSLKKGIPIVAELLTPDGDMLCLVKPLFEVEDSEIRRTGKITDKTIYQDVLYDLVEFVETKGYVCVGVTHSPVTGNKGTREFFLWVSLDSGRKKRNIDHDISKAIEEVAALNKYNKK